MVNQSQKTPATATLEEVLRAKGIPVSTGSAKERKSGKAVAPVPPGKAFVFQRPAVPKISVVLQSTEERAKALADFEGFRSEVVQAMHDYVGQLCAINGMGETERPLYAEARKQLLDAIEGMLNYDHPAAKSVGTIAYSDAMIKTCPRFRGSVVWTFSQLVKVGFWTESAETFKPGSRPSRPGQIRAYSKTYSLAKEYSRNEEAQEILDSASKLVAATVAEGRERFEESLEALRQAQGDQPLTLEQLRTSNTVGRILLPVEEEWMTGKDGKSFPHAGGYVLVEADGEGRLQLVGAAGGLQRIAEELIEAGAWVWSNQLASERVEFKERVPENVFRNVRIVHNMIRRGISAAEKQGERDEFRASVEKEAGELAAKATLSPVEFFLAEKPGLVFCRPAKGTKFLQKEFGAKGEKPKVTVHWFVMFVAERDEQGRIRVAECPKRLEGLFAGQRDFVPAGEKFTNLRWPLGILLRMAFAETFVNATEEERKLLDSRAQQAEQLTGAEQAEAGAELAEQFMTAAGEEGQVNALPVPTADAE